MGGDLKPIQAWGHERNRMFLSHCLGFLVHQKIARRLLTAVCLLLITPSFSSTFILPTKGNEVGEIEYIYPDEGETLIELGLRHDMGYREMLKANPGINPDVPLPSRIRLLIPSRFTLPTGPRHGLVINLADYRLYFFPENENVVLTYPVGIGRKGWETPLGSTTVISKQVNPEWHPTAKVQAYAASKGVFMPDRFPSGKANPLGKHVLRLGWPTYLIHGANSTDGIGDRVSAGCIRMLPEDIEYLFGFVGIGTSVRVVND